jgi:lipoprotein NlpD
MTALWRSVFVLMALQAAGCVEMVRWQDEPPRRHAPQTRTTITEPAVDGHYVVKGGDTVYSIAFRNQLDFRELAAWNGIGADYLIRPGQVLRLAPPWTETAAGASSIMTFPAERPEPLPMPEAVVTAPQPESRPASLPSPAVHSPQGRWRWPTSGTVVRSFGAPVPNGTSKGLTIAGTLGQPVVAAAPGKVVYSGSALKGYGELIIVKHDDVYLTAYGHNRRRLVAEGQEVAAGQPIAELGIGPEQRPVLHFEIREKGRPINPAPLLPAR